MDNHTLQQGPSPAADGAGGLVIREQPRLPLGTQVEICADGIHHRLFRSLTTLVVVTLAVAFLMNMLAESVVVSSCKRGVAAELRRQRQFGQLASLPRLRDDERAFQRRLAAAAGDSLEAGVLARWMGLEVPAFAAIQGRAAAAERMQKWFEDLSVSYRRLLFDTGRIEQPLVLLGQPGQWKQFAERAHEIPTLEVPRELEAVVKGYGEYRPELLERRQAVLDQVDRLNADLGRRGQELDAWLAAACTDAGQARDLAAFLAGHGVAVSEAQARELAEEGCRTLQLRAVQRALTALQSHPDWEARSGGGMTQSDALKRLARQDAVGRWLSEQMAPSLQGVIEPGRLSELAGQFERTFGAEDLQVKLAVEYGREEGMGTRAFWLVVVSMVVCVVGIANAMLVSVLERFREIATMKCLGAMDGLIATLFLLEAAFLGVVGGVAGVLVGSLIGLGRMTIAYGGWVWTFFQATGMLRMAGLSILTGLLLTTLAAIYPAFKAAKMLPMEAMRVE